MELLHKKQPEVEGLLSQSQRLLIIVVPNLILFCGICASFSLFFSQILKDFAKGQMEGGGQPGVMKKRAKAGKLCKPDSYKNPVYCVLTEVFQLLEVS